MTILTLIRNYIKPNLDKIHRTEQYMNQHQIKIHQQFENRFL
ncbi:hypothetical protein J2S74_000848 [Evansella vedderi]|uniref:Uncharacterized protein n=1 Tax=Evansella vedderi TaxID=38282 RepID=A0ABT9ZQF7_9BACI|nr:hypothetical protein [Evansella vedderi]MDQ0253476.1 hypothetical protein [Evansella vedderi]